MGEAEATTEGAAGGTVAKKNCNTINLLSVL